MSEYTEFYDHVDGLNYAENTAEHVEMSMRLAELNTERHNLLQRLNIIESRWSPIELEEEDQEEVAATLSYRLTGNTDGVDRLLGDRDALVHLVEVIRDNPLQMGILTQHARGGHARTYGSKHTAFILPEKPAINASDVTDISIDVAAQVELKSWGSHSKMNAKPLKLYLHEVRDLSDPSQELPQLIIGTEQILDWLMSNLEADETSDASTVNGIDHLLKVGVKSGIIPESFLDEIVSQATQRLEAIAPLNTVLANQYKATKERRDRFRQDGGSKQVKHLTEALMHDALKDYQDVNTEYARWKKLSSIALEP